MKNKLRNAVQQKRQHLIDELLKIGVFKKNNMHLYEWPLSDLEKEYNEWKHMIWIESNTSVGRINGK
ncbi:Fur-regulated basic protein FbpA [Neobacillus pocheonensis]|uniref:Fur-regulated basic protein FbpA n=1 Tax=Neobacillus pocheonensis TaxID=363869 RepID=UPI003D27574F